MKSLPVLANLVIGTQWNETLARLRLGFDGPKNSTITSELFGAYSS